MIKVSKLFEHFSIIYKKKLELYFFIYTYILCTNVGYRYTFFPIGVEWGILDKEFFDRKFIVVVTSEKSIFYFRSRFLKLSIRCGDFLPFFTTHLS